MDKRWDMADLEGALSTLGPRLAFPEQPDLAAAVMAGIAAERPARAGLGRWRSWRPAVAVAASLVALVAALLIFSPTTREAVADWIGLDGVRITFGDEPRSVPLGKDLALGDRVSLSEAREAVDFDIELLGSLGEPDEVYLQQDRPGGRVALVYEATDGLPRTDETGVGALFSQFEATYDRDIAEKKIIAEGGFVEAVEVGSTEGYWIGGGPHTIGYLDANGQFRGDQVRLAGNTLLWQRGGIVFRLESSLSKNEAIRLAETSR